MNPQNGQILAMASYPDYDLNNPRTPTSYFADDWDNLSSSEQTTRLLDMWKVRSVSETYEPGSVFKLVTASVALEENITETDVEGEFICNGYEQVKDRTIQCWYYPRTHGHQSLREALMNSCNPALIQLGRRIGAETMWKYMDAFGLFDKTGVGLSGESSGVFFKSVDDINEVELATLSFGQRFTVTPLQMCTAVSTIANGGYLVKPQIVKSIKNTDTGEVTNFETTKVRQVISTGTANRVKDMMLSVVADGTGTRAGIKGYTIGGKSGTSEASPANPDAGYVTSFTAITPIENTQVVVLVTLYAPQGASHQGGSTAAPVVHDILEESLPYLGIEPNM